MDKINGMVNTIMGQDFYERMRKYAPTYKGTSNNNKFYFLEQVVLSKVNDIIILTDNLNQLKIYGDIGFTNAL